MAGESSTIGTDAAAALAAQAAASTHQYRPAPTTSLSHSIDKLDGTMATGHSNYNAWCFRLIRILKEKELLTILMEGTGSTMWFWRKPVKENSEGHINHTSFSNEGYNL